MMSKSSSSLAKILDSQWIEFDDNSSDEKAAATEEVALNGDPDDYDNNVLKNKKVEEQVLEFEFWNLVVVDVADIICDDTKDIFDEVRSYYYHGLVDKISAINHFDKYTSFSNLSKVTWWKKWLTCY